MCRTLLTTWSGWDGLQFIPDILKNKKAMKNIVNTIANITTYLKMINTDLFGQWDFAAPSSGNWEEFPFPGGLTWDLTATRMAFARMRDLLHSACAGADQQVRAALVGTKNGGWLQDKIRLDRVMSKGIRPVLNKEVRPVPDRFRCEGT